MIEQPVESPDPWLYSASGMTLPVVLQPDAGLKQWPPSMTFQP